VAAKRAIWPTGAVGSCLWRPYPFVDRDQQWPSLMAAGRALNSSGSSAWTRRVTPRRCQLR